MEIALGIMLIASGVALGLGALWWKVRASDIQANSELPAASVSASQGVPASPPTVLTMSDAPLGLEAAAMTDEVTPVAQAIHIQSQEHPTVYGKTTVKQPEDSAGDGPKPAEETSPEQSDEAVLYRLARELLEEVDKVVRGIIEQAKRDAEAETAKIRAEAEKRARNEALEQARAESEARSQEAIRAAEERAEVVLRGANEVASRLIRDAKEKAERLDSKARARLSRVIDTLTAEVSPEVANLPGPYGHADGDGSDAAETRAAMTALPPSTPRPSSTAGR